MEAGEELPQFLEHFVTAMTSLAEPNPCQDHILGIFIWFVSPFFLAVLVVVSLELCCFATRGRTAPGLWRPSLFGKKEKEWRRRILEFCFPEFEMEASKDQPTAYCVICQEACSEGDKLRRITCTHTFHSLCIVLWVAETSNSCPLCRCPVLSSSSSRTYQEYLAMQKKGLRTRVQSATAQPS
mmetsp:Transcript_30308/g.116238  ORF Transcript_30308/g.116238 Transcript_30308/m.116238 type:complete len:183 (+) Transcript_30308:522-1070(+)